MPTSRCAGIGRHIWIISINYAPEPTGFAPHVSAFCKYLVQRGNRVAVFTGFPFAPRWSRWPNYKGEWQRLERLDGVEVHRHTHFIPRSPKALLQRIMMEGSFCLTAGFSLLFSRTKPSAVIYVGAQPSLAMLARLVAWVRHVPYGIIVNDLATGAAADVGILRAGLLLRMLHWFEFTAYRRAAGAVVLCESFFDALVAEGVPAARIRIIRSPVDIDAVRPGANGLAFRLRHGLTEEKFVVLYAGSMGLKQGLENVIAAACLVRDRCPSVRWVLVGEGETRTNVERLMVANGLGETVIILPFQPVEQLSAMFAASDVCLLNQRANLTGTVIPSKLLTYMSAGRPVVAAVNDASQGAALLRASGGGRIVAPDSPSALAEAVAGLVAVPDTRSRMGRANRAYAEEHFDQNKVLPRLEEFARRLSSEKG